MLIKKSLQFEPELIFIYRGTHIKPNTIQKIKKLIPSCFVYGYNNDDPFSKGHPVWLWRYFLNSVPYYDLIFAYRKHNIAEYQKLGAKRTELLMPWFIPSKDRPVNNEKQIHKKYDVVFVGHYESDDRVDYLSKITEDSCSFGLFGPDWDHAPQYHWLDKHQPVMPLRGDSYRETITSSHIALCFLSKLNRDTYTRRCFEIPAMGVMMLCQYTDDLAGLFEDGVDAVFFHNPSDMIKKIEFYLQNKELRDAIAANGLKRIHEDGHDINSRMNYVLQFLSEER